MSRTDQGSCVVCAGEMGANIVCGAMFGVFGVFGVFGAITVLEWEGGGWVGGIGERFVEANRAERRRKRKAKKMFHNSSP